MRIISETTVRGWAAASPSAATSLNRWRDVTLEAEWANFAEVRASFGSADQVTVSSGRRVVVFNIAGNKFRLIAALHYNTGIVYTLRFLSHAEYDKHKWKDEP